jgi:hypothetical protein
VNLTDIPAFFDKLKKQIRFATARALTISAEQAQAWMTSTHLPSKIRLRTQWWKPGRKFGVNRSVSWRGSSVELDDMSSRIYSRAPWLIAQDKGELKQPKGKNIIIPIVGSAARGNITRVVNRRLKPKASDGKGVAPSGVFFLKRLNGWFRRVGKKNPKLQMLFKGVPFARVKPVAQFEEKGKEYAEARFKDNYQQELAKAIATMK